jgi:DNA-binding transcriptional MocR family regulator
MDTAVDTGTSLYHRVAGELERAIAGGSLRVGDRLPSVRQLSLQHGVSASTVTQAYRWLENRALVEARPKSGYFVASPRTPLPEPQIDTRMDSAAFVTNEGVTRGLLSGADDRSALPSFFTMPHASLLPVSRLRQITASINRQRPEYATDYHLSGSLALRLEIARRSVTAGVHLRPDEIIITNGCTEALSVALRTVAQAGDTIALESPTYFGLLDMVKSCGMRSLEIPTHPRDGISIEALDFATRGQRAGDPTTTAHAVRACMVIPNFQNPLGSLMPVANKRRLVALAAERGFALIESDVYGETHFGDERPPALQAFDTHGDVLLCSSFSKMVSPGLRVGWLAAGKHFHAAQAMKFSTSMCNARLPQEVLAQFLQNGGYDHHMRRLRSSLKLQSQHMVDAVTRYFPPGCRLSQPQGGLILWIELPPQVDSRRVFEHALNDHIGIAPGTSFSCSQRYHHFIRMHYGAPWSAKLDANLRRLGHIVATCAG